MTVEREEGWHAELSTSGDAWNVLDESRNRVATVHRTGEGARADAYLLAAAPQLREQLATLLEWVENNVAYGAPRIILEGAGQALEDSKEPQ